MKHKEVLRRRDRLSAHLPTAEILRGSLLQRTIRHISLRPEQKELVEKWLNNYHQLKDRMEEVCELNQLLLRPEP